MHLKKYLGNIGFNKKCKTKSENGFENETCACMKDNCIRIEKVKWRPIIPTTTSSSSTTSKVSISRKIKMIILTYMPCNRHRLWKVTCSQNKLNFFLWHSIHVKDKFYLNFSSKKVGYQKLILSVFISKFIIISGFTNKNWQN